MAEDIPRKLLDVPWVLDAFPIRSPKDWFSGLIDSFTPDRFAVISDVHGNLEALRAVLRDIDSRGVKHVICLGDVVGYGPNPVECIELLLERGIDFTKGNHEHEILSPDHGWFNTIAERALDWTRERIRSKPYLWKVLESARDVASTIEPNVRYLHGSPSDPISDYIMDPARAGNRFEAKKRGIKIGNILLEADYHITLFGHTHHGMVYKCRKGAPERFETIPSFDIESGLLIDHTEETALVNPGSVGQPRDLDPRASYVLLERITHRNYRLRYVRVPYNIFAVQQKIAEIPELDDELALRLAKGK